MIAKTSPRASRRPAWPALCLALGLALALAACSRRATEEPPVQPPLGTLNYRLVLERQSGGAVDPDAVARAAGELATRIERRMTALAAALGYDDWRSAFEALRDARPAGGAAVLTAYREAMERAAAFVAARDLVTLPPALPEVAALESPALRDRFALGLFHQGTFAVTLEPGTGDPTGAYLANHCDVCIPPLAVHEGYPGHHVAFWHWSRGGAPPAPDLARYRTLVEGWGLYAEWLMLERGYYREPGAELGAWRLVLLRALRAAVDGNLHAGVLSPEAAAELYRRELLMTPAAAAAEVRTHLDKPGAKASYFVGLLQLLELRHQVLTREPALGFRPFHDRLLEAPGAIPDIARQRFGVELGPQPPPESILSPDWIG